MKVIFKNVSLEFQRDATEVLPFTNGYYVKSGNGAGSLSDSASGYYTAELIDITNFSTLVYKVSINNAGYEVAFYTDGVELSHDSMVSHFISGSSVVGNGSFTEKTLDLSSAKAAGAKYVIVSHYGGSDSGVYATLIP